MSRMTFTARSLALLAGVFLGCGGSGDEAPKPSTHHQMLTALESACESARQPRLVAAPSDEAPEGLVHLEGKDLNCGETYALVVTRPDGTSTSESLTADTQGKVHTTYLVEGPPGEHQVRLYDSNGEEVAQTLYYNPTFRYGHLTWRTVGPRTAEFSVVNAFRRAYPGSGPDGLAVTGDTFQETLGGTRLCFGEGFGSSNCTSTLTYEVTSYNAEQGWLLARAFDPGQPQTQPGTGVVVAETEPNNTLGTANSMQLGDDYFSNISVSGDSDHVRFTLSQRTRIEVRTRLLTLGDSYLYLYNSTGALLAFNDNGGGGLSSLITLTLEAGTYYIRAEGYNNSYTGQQYVQLRQVALSPPGPITRTYSSDGPFTASISGCCRISGLSNSSSYYTDYRVRTQVRFTPANSSPVSTLAPIVDAPVNTPGFTFQIPATDAEGDQLTFRLATYGESYLYYPPSGLTVSSTGLVRWSTVGTVVGQLWAAQVIIEERRGGVLIGSSAVDFLLRMTSRAPTCLPPSQTGYTVEGGQPVQFTVGTRDEDAWDTLTLTASGVPSGAALQPALPLRGPSGISTTFSWTPYASAVGNTYPVSFTVTDSTGREGQCTVSITVQAPSNWPPVADAGPDQVVPEGSTVTLNGGGSRDEEGQALTYQWSVVDSTGPALTLSSPTSATPSFTASDDGVYTLRLTVTDSEGAIGSDTVVVRVDNVAPQVSATGGQLDEGQVFLSSGSFTDPGADAWSARVNYGDGSDWQPLALNQGAFTLSHPYTDNGTFQVQIAVRDDDGGQSTLSVQVEVNNVVPWIVGPPELVTDQGQPFSTPVTFGDPGADSWLVSVDYGDGRSEYLVPWGREFVLQYTYWLPGTYSLTVTIMDEDGGQVTTTIPVVVHNLVPDVDCCFLWPPTIDEGLQFTARGAYKDPSIGLETFTITVDYGDGTGVQPVEDRGWSNFEFQHVYAESGTYLVTVTVTDGFGGVGSATIQVEVHNVAPRLDELQWDYWDVIEGSPTLFWGSFHDPGQDTWTIQVDYGDGTGLETLESTTHGFQLNHTFPKVGGYLMTLTITDDDGGVGSFQQWIWVENVDPEVSLPESGEGIEGSAFHSAGSFTDPGADTWTAWVYYGDGSVEPLALNGKTFELEHVYANSGIYWVSIYVEDGDGGWGWASMRVTVHNVAPAVSLTGGESFEGQHFVSTGSFTDLGAEIYGWSAQVDYGDGGGWQTLWLEGNSFTLSHVYGDSGVYQVTVQVFDGDGVGTATAQVVVHNVAPVVTLYGGMASEGIPGYVLVFVNDPAMWWDTFSVHVDYGDGSPVEHLPFYYDGIWLSHTYADDGTYLVTVTVIDDDGGIGTATLLQEVENVAPWLYDFVDGSGTPEGSTYTVRGWVHEPGADTWTGTVDFGDGSPLERIFPTPGSPNTFELSHVYDDSGYYQMSITLTDEDGGMRVERRWTWIDNVAPTVTATHDSPRPWGVPVSLVGTAVDPSQADTRAGFTSLWTLGDGTTASGLTTAHVYAAPGSYPATLTVKDKDDGGWINGTGRASTTVTIHRRPGAVTCAETTAVYGTSVALGASFLDGLPGGLPGGKSLSFRLGTATDLGVATTDATGQARVQSPGELMPGRYELTVSFAGDSLYTAAEARCTLSVIQSNGTITGGGLRLAGNSRGGFNVMLAEGSAPRGELQFQSDTTAFHAHTMTALGLSVDKRRGWFAGVGGDGRAFTVYVEDNGEPGSEDVFRLWIDGDLQTGGGVLSGGNIQIH